ncbi:unnamed protein product [Calypogeia fissa]
MCYPQKCAKCSKTTWAGCGKHVPSVFQKIPKGQACMCKGWPGVVFPKEEAKSEGTETKETSASEAAAVAST